MRSSFGTYGLALASLGSLASAAVGLNEADADFSLLPSFTLEPAGAPGFGKVVRADDSRGVGGKVYVMDRRGKDPVTSPVDGGPFDLQQRFLQVDIPVPWPTGATVGAPFGIKVEFLASDVDSHYLSGTVTSDNTAAPGCGMWVLASWGDDSVKQPGTTTNLAFPRPLWWGDKLAPRSVIKPTEYDTRYGTGSVGIELVVPENFDEQPQNLIVHVRQVCNTPTSNGMPLFNPIVNDFLLTRVQAYLSNPVEPPSTVTTDPAPSGTDEPVPTGTDKPVPTGTDGPVPTGTDGPVPTGTDEPVPTGTDEPVPTGTDEPVPTGTDEPVPTSTDEPVPTDTDGPAPTGEPTDSPTGGNNSNTSSPTTTPGPVPTGDADLPGPLRIGEYKYAGCVSSPPPSAGSSPFVLAATRADNSLDVCASICQGQNKTLSGAFGADCYCGNGDAGALSTVDNSACDTPCPGNPAQNCGGRLLLSKRYLQARQAPAVGVLLTVYVFVPADDSTTTTTTVAPPAATGSGVTINNVNNITNSNTNVNNISVNVNVMVPVTCLPGACETEVYYERVCEVCKPDEEAWRPIRCAGDACVDKVVCRPEPAPKCVGDCWVEAPCTKCEGGVVYKPQAQPVAPAEHTVAVLPEHTVAVVAEKTAAAPAAVYTAGARAIAANMGSLVALLAPAALVFFA
ncbi:hypothetical protein MAPG_05884 [Magnaporthiopsis poae ATCC 64411]|uniref:WSC domain-containing protein n=1 Tax=Magnaporthiopsis poae (strain ATCC 64411 / 73-15) TaxID=644358 RepID=A0A0C4E0K6_MAGP6|nr:hypothetical protein MAPG_05884 [Magnaporthiopsis poae ATCC 64411]